MTRLAGITATYNAGRVTWDPEKMAAFVERHPEMLEFRKVGKPWVALRFGDASGPRPVSERGEVKMLSEGERREPSEASQQP